MEDWDQLRYFLAVARARTLSAAAERLRVDTSTVHRRLGALERRLGARLFDRLSRGFVLTAEGEELLATAERVDADIVAAERCLTGSETKPAGKVRLTTVDAWASYPLGGILLDLRARFPEIEVEVTVTPRLLSLTRRETDLALRPGAAPTELGVIGRHIGQLGVAMYASKQYIETRAAPRSYDDLAGHPIVTGDDSLAHVRFVRFVLERVQGATLAFRGDSVAVIANAVRAGFGIGAIPCSLADREPDLVRVLPPHPDLSVGIWLLMHEDLRRTARVRVIADALFEALLEPRALVVGRGAAAAPAPPVRAVAAARSKRRRAPARG